jgi:uncharacterized membrane protein
MKFEEKILINRTPKKVFKYLSNFNSHKKFSEHFKDSKNLSGKKMEEGSELFTKIIFLGRKIESTNQVVAFVPEKEIKYKSVSGPVPAEAHFLLEDKGDSTVVTFHYDIEPGSFFNMEEMFLKPRFESIVSNSMRNLKKILENMAA